VHDVARVFSASQYRSDNMMATKEREKGRMVRLRLSILFIW